MTTEASSNALQIAAPRSAPAILDLPPEQMIQHAASVAKVLKDVIVQQRLWQNIQGKEYVKAEGWVTLGSLLGILPREREVKELDDGSYEAHVDLVNFRSGLTVGGASAICGMDEGRWRKADRYARRSMAITRATGKAYRLCFSWIMALAGYEPTPAEEMPGYHTPRQEPSQTYEEPQQVEVIDYASRVEVAKYLREADVPEEDFSRINQLLAGRPFSKASLLNAVGTYHKERARTKKAEPGVVEEPQQ